MERAARYSGFDGVLYGSSDTLEYYSPGGGYNIIHDDDDYFDYDLGYGASYNYGALKTKREPEKILHSSSSSNNNNKPVAEKFFYTGTFITNGDGHLEFDDIKLEPLAARRRVIEEEEEEGKDHVFSTSNTGKKEDKKEEEE